MALSAIPRGSNQLPLIARSQDNPHWINLSSDVQQKVMRLMAQLLRQYRKTLAEAGIAEGVTSD